MTEQESKRDVKITGDGNIAGDDILSQVAKIDAEKVSDAAQIHIAEDYSISCPDSLGGHLRYSRSLG